VVELKSFSTLFLSAAFVYVLLRSENVLPLKNFFMIRLVFLIVVILASFQMQAQVFTEALRYSRLDFGGTARTVGVGGSMSALGTDFAVLSTNPAGLAAYRSSDFMFTPAFKFNSTTSTLEGVANGDVNKNSVRLLIDNVGFVYASEPLASNWTALNFGIGINKLADFNRKFNYEGVSQGSIVDRFIEQSFGFLEDELYPFEEGLALETEAIFPTNEPGVYGSDFSDAPEAIIFREESVKTTGAMNEFVVSGGANFKHKLLMGLTLGIPILNYTIQRTYSEENFDGTVPNFNDLTFTEKITTSGAGVNLKVGIIYRPVQMLRVGLAYHTPTKLRLDDEWENSLNYDFTFQGQNFDQTAEAAVDQPFEYTLRTPMRAMGSLAVLFNKRGFLSADVEYVDYSKNKFDLTINTSDTGTQQLERALNQRIEGEFDSGLNVKVGGELAVDIFRIRAGYGMFGTSYADKSSFDPSYSLGFGMRKETYYLDIAYKLTQFEDEHIPYYLVDDSQFQGQEVNNKTNAHKIIVTLGFRF
jgi:Outer membrane protein transport protein (OMPP1/FadL/TodX)